MPAADTARSALAFTRRRWRGLLRAAAGLLVLIIVLQNAEPTSVDVLFWSFARVPKVVLILGSMVVGAGAWVVLRRLLGAYLGRGPSTGSGP